MLSLLCVSLPESSSCIPHSNVLLTGCGIGMILMYQSASVLSKDRFLSFIYVNKCYEGRGISKPGTSQTFQELGIPTVSVDPVQPKEVWDSSRWTSPFLRKHRTPEVYVGGKAWKSRLSHMYKNWRKYSFFDFVSCD